MGRMESIVMDEDKQFEVDQTKLKNYTARLVGSWV